MAARALSNRTSTANILLQSLGRCSFNRTVGAASGVVVNRPLSTDSADAATSDEKSINVDRRPSTAPAPARHGRRDDFLPAFFSGIYIEIHWCPWYNLDNSTSEAISISF